MPDVDREKKIAAAKRKLRKFKQNKKVQNKKVFKDDESSIASEEIMDENVGGDSLQNLVFENSIQEKQAIETPIETELNYSSDAFALMNENHNKNSSVKPQLTQNIDHSKENGSENTFVSNLINLNHTSASQCVNHSSANQHESDTKRIEIEKTELVSLQASNQSNLSCEDSSSLLPTNITDANDATVQNSIEDVAYESVIHCESSPDEAEISSASAEKLLQISTKLNGLAAEAQSVIANGDDADKTSDKYIVTELENRNLHLADQVAALTRQKQDLMLQVDQLTQQMAQLHHRLESEKQQIYSHGVNEQNTLRQQLQVQMQTISILVAEKQELQHQIHEARSSMLQEQNSRQKFQDQLQDAKLSIQKFERDLKANNDSLAILTTVKTELNEERDRLQTAVHKLTKSSDEHSMHAGELGKKLTIKEEECKRLSLELDDLHEKLSMAEVLLQQLSNSSNVSAESQLKQIQEERESLNQKLIEYQQAFEQLTGEREQLSRQYEDMNDQMQKQVTELSGQVTELESEKCELQHEVDELQQNVKRLEDELRRNAVDNQDEQIVDERASLVARLEQTNHELKLVVDERDDVKTKLNHQLLNNERLAKLNEEQELQLNQLNRSISESNLSADEHSKLLEQSQNDKATISRALSQNKQLKQQLEEMHDGFIKLSNDKMELASQLATTEHRRKELEEEVEELKATLTEMEENMSTKETNLDQLQAALHQAQLSSARNDESALESVRTDLLSSQETVNILGDQNNQLKAMITQLQSNLDQSQQKLVSIEKNEDRAEDDDHDSRDEDDDDDDDDDNEETSSSDENDESTVAMLSSSLHQLEQERDVLSKKFEEEQRRSVALSEQLLHLEGAQHADDEVSVDEHKQLIRNMSLLQDRFSTVMKEKVDALNKVEELEHINLQLQNECDTVGEYITLYHNQRQVMKQRHHEKDEYVTAIVQEKEFLQNKVERLQSLFQTMMKNKSSSSSSETPLTSSPVKSRDQTIEETSNPPSEWPDMLEDEEGRPQQSSRPDLLPDLASLPSGADVEASSSPDKVHHFPGKFERIPNDADTSTTSEIINLLEQMQRPVKSNLNDAPSGFCLRYMGPYTAI